jgi:hypothetical protein
MDAATLLPRLIEGVMALVVVEAAVLHLLRRLRGIGPGLAPYAVNLASGFCLMLALRNALAGTGTIGIVLPLMLSFAAHLTDLARSWRR